MELTRMSPIGIIANPASGKDIRRIVSGARVVSHQEKANIIHRLIAGIMAIGPRTLLLMPDTSGLSRKICDAVRDSGPVPRMVEMPLITGDWRDTLSATRALNAAGAGVIVTLGGDGTNRIVAKACEDIPVLPISTGTNNAFPQLIEGTLAGLAAARIADAGVTAHEFCRRAPKLEVVDAAGDVVDIALVEVAVVRAGVRGALAVWDMDEVHSVFISNVRSDVIGLSAIAGALAPQGSATRIVLGRGARSVRAAIAPGIVPDIPVADVQPLIDGVPVPLGPPGAMLALDGERELRLDPDRPLFVRLSRMGPLVVDVARVLSAADHPEKDHLLPTEEKSHGT